MQINIVSSLRSGEYCQQGHPERPKRVIESFKYLKSKGFEFLEPQPCSEQDLLMVHSRELLEKIKSGSFFDADTPALGNIYEYASLSAGAAILAQELCSCEKFVFSLMRPPGHHATGEHVGGFCYFNNIAIAVKKSLNERFKKAAILDIDCHHGNGTEEIFSGKKNVLYVSLHQVPLYPGTGLTSHGNCLNFPLEPKTEDKEYLATLRKAVSEIKKFGPEILGVSAGFDTYRKDPLTDINLRRETYLEIGKSIARLEIPCFALLEGGYSSDLPLCIEQFLLGFSK